MLEVNWKAAIISGIIFAIITSVLFIIAYDFFPVKLDISDSEKKVILILGFAMLVFTTGTFLALTAYQIIQLRRLDYFRRNGIPAVGTVLSVKNTGNDEGRIRQFEIELRISIRGEQDYYIKKKIHAPENYPDRLQPGESFEVLVDRNNRNNVFIEI